jgi:hypothetical protein
MSTQKKKSIYIFKKVMYTDDIINIYKLEEKKLI